MLLRINDILSDPLNFLISFLLMLPGACLAISVHESAHGWVAEKCGDPTARYAGRITLNPVKHFDPIGFLCLLFVGFGWAKPVPVNPLLYKNYRKDDIKVSLAGITANLCLFLVCVILSASVLMIRVATMPTYKGLYTYYYNTESKQREEVFLLESNRTPESSFIYEDTDGSKYIVYLTEGSWQYRSLNDSVHKFVADEDEAANTQLIVRNEYVSVYSVETLARYFYAFTGDNSVALYGKLLSILVRMLAYCMFINMSLAIFNLIPIPPLDGYHVLNDLVLKQDLFAQRRTQQICMFVLIGVILIGNIKPEWDIISIAISWVANTVLGGVGSIIVSLSKALSIL